MSYIEKALKIPEKEKRLIIVASFNVGHKLEPPKSDLILLFKMFDKYINAYKLDLNCNHCRKTIRDFWINAVKEWTVM